MWVRWQVFEVVGQREQEWIGVGNVEKLAIGCDIGEVIDDGVCGANV